MAQLIKHRAVAVDSWTTLDIAEGETPETVALPAGDVIFPLAVWLARKAEIISCHKRIGLLLQPDERVEDVAADLEYFVVIAVAFPKFVDGRGYSTASLLRQRYQYQAVVAGEGARRLHDVLLGIAIIGAEGEEFVQLAGVVFIGLETGILHPV